MILLSELPLNFQEQNLQPNVEVNLQAITLYASHRWFVLEPTRKITLIDSKLRIDRQTGDIEELHGQVAIAQAKPLHFSFLLGILELEGSKVLCLVEEALLVCTINRRDIFRITNPVFIFFNRGYKPTESQNYQIRALTLLLKSGMFFSYSYDLTLRVFSHEKRPSRNSNYNWIFNLQKPLQRCKERWAIPVVQGFVGKFSIYVQGKKLLFVLISRRSTKMAGTRFIARGINQDAFVANYVETEQIMIYQNYLASYVHVRGSLPLYWRHIDEYKGLVKDIEILKSKQANIEVCGKHLSTLKEQYGHVTIVNLLQQTKKTEAKLISSFECVVRQLLTHSPESFNYAYYDVKKVGSAKGKSVGSNYFIQTSLLEVIQQQGTDCYYIDPNTQQRSLKSQQKGIFRTNCLDCVERTGQFQSKLSAMVLVEFFRHFHINLVSGWIQGGVLDFFEDTSHPLVKLFRCIWADNADFISQQYTGTNSVNSLYEHNGKWTPMGPVQQGITSVWRMLIDVGSYDLEKTKTIEKLLGNDGSNRNDGQSEPLIEHQQSTDRVLSKPS